MDEIHFAPLQGYTDLAHRNAYFQLIGDVDFYYTPYFSVDDNLSYKPKIFLDGLFNLTIPQILPGNMNELKKLFNFISELHFLLININLGCPYPMVTRKGRGAGLILKPNLVSEMIQFINDHSKLKISLKTRLGLSGETEIFNLLEKIGHKKIETVIIHPRTAKQLYNGNASIEIFKKCKEMFPNFDFIYNGDINSVEDFVILKDQIPEQKKWMLGRGLLSNPLLAWQIKNGDHNLPENFKEKLIDFVFLLIANIERDSKDEGHALNRVKSQFAYLSNSFPDSRKLSRLIKKSKSIGGVKEILNGIG